MKRNLFFGFAVILLMFGLTGCCKQFWPEKIVFTPEVQMGIDEEIKKHNIENPIILVVGDDGSIVALGKEGHTFMPCRPPEQYDNEDKIASGDTSQKKSTKPAQTGKSRVAAANRLTTAKAINIKDLPICEGMVNIQKVQEATPITILNVKKNPRCRIVRSSRGGYQEKCR